MSVDVAKAESTYAYTPYMMEDSYITQNFDSVPSGNNCWRWTDCTSSQVFLCGGDLNAPDVGGNPDDPYVIMQVCQDVPAVLYQPFIYIDEITIAIY